MNKMNNRIRVFLCFLVIVTLCVCCNSKFIVVNGYDNDYDKLNDTMRTLIHPLVEFDSLKNGIVYPISPDVLLAELSNHQKSIVYLYSKGCNSATCQPISYYKQFADENQYKLFVVLRSYYSMEQAISEKLDIPLFVINDEYYKEKRLWVYERYFFNDLIGYPTDTKTKDLPEEIKYSNIFVYENGKLVETPKTVPF